MSTSTGKVGYRPRPGDEWFAICTARAVFAVVVRDGQVVEAAPYTRRVALGRPWEQVRKYWARRGAAVYALPKPANGTKPAPGRPPARRRGGLA